MRSPDFFGKTKAAPVITTKLAESYEAAEKVLRETIRLGDQVGKAALIRSDNSSNKKGKEILEVLIEGTKKIINENLKHKNEPAVTPDSSSEGPVNQSDSTFKF